MFVLKIVTDFASAHSLRDYPGDCSRLHGHNWQVEVMVSSQVLDEFWETPRSAVTYSE